jgi:hypothetical protein
MYRKFLCKKKAAPYSSNLGDFIKADSYKNAKLLPKTDNASKKIICGGVLISILPL